MHEVVAGTVVGMVNPGEMGASVAGALVAQGVRVIWASEGRSEHSHRRAQAAGLEDAGSLEQLANAADIIVCVGPPDQAATVARAAASASFHGLYVDANAVAPATALARERSAGLAVTVTAWAACFTAKCPGTGWSLSSSTV